MAHNFSAVSTLGAVSDIKAKKKPEPKPAKPCRFCTKPYIPALRENLKRDWCHDYKCEEKRESEHLAYLTDYLRKKRESKKNGNSKV